jgi:hypothetical protein
LNTLLSLAGVAVAVVAKADAPVVGVVLEVIEPLLV